MIRACEEEECKCPVSDIGHASMFLFSKFSLKCFTLAFL